MYSGDVDTARGEPLARVPSAEPAGIATTTLNDADSV
jgi:hypothetical protein